MNSPLRDYLYFSKTQRSALIIVVILIFSSLLFNRYAHLLYSDKVELEIEVLEARYEDLLARQSEAKIEIDFEETADERKIKLFPFNPNEIKLNEWQALGLSQAQANSILKYLDKGGVFRSKADLKKMYVISESRYQSLESYILLPDEVPSKSRETYSSHTRKKSYKAISLELNTADSADFTQLRGIGPVYAGRIVKFRDALGGFHAIDQLGEVWGIDDTLVSKLRPQLNLTEIQLNTIKINQVEAKELKSHPYLNWQQSNAIVNYRKQHGKFSGSADLSKIYSISDSLIRKLSPYLEFD